jgi:hypothetical protein
VGASNTAITELVSDGKGYPVDLSTETAPLPIMENGTPVTESRRRVDVVSCLEQLDVVYSGDTSSVVKSAFENAQTFSKQNDSFMRLVSGLFSKLESRRNGKSQDKLVFCQYGSAGDILITTGILEALEKKYGVPVDYMTQPAYFDILEGNPHVGKILDWDMKVAEKYKIYAYPHKAIRSGNWGTNDVSLYDVYAQLCEVEYGKMFIDPVEPLAKDGTHYIWSDYVTIHNQGGHPYRLYPYMDLVIQKMKEIHPNLGFVQIGAGSDPKVESAFDLRGLKFRESAFVIKNSLIHIGIDSFPSHCAAAMGKEQICLFGCGAKRVVAPRGMSVNLEPDYVKYCPILGPCWGNYRDCKRPCIHAIEPETIATQALQLLEKVRNV